jgi:hypothetical protein
MAQEVDIYDDSFSEDSFSQDEFLEEEEKQDGGAGKPKATAPIPKRGEEMIVVKTHELAKTPMPEAPSKPKFVAPAPPPPPSCFIPMEQPQEDVSTEDDSSSSSSSSSDDESEGSTIDYLSRDPLFLVLSQFLSCDKGNITEALFKINSSLKKIAKLLEHQH